MEDGMRLLALVDSPDHVCCRYRIRAFEPALRDAGCSLVCQAVARSFVARLSQLRSAARYHAVIVQRKLLPNWQLALLRRHARHLIFDFDDAVLYRDSYDERGPDSARRGRRFAAMARAADTVIAGNDFLADCALRAGASAERVRTIPTCVDPHRYLPRTERPARGGRPLELVWIGSSSTLKGLESQRALWERLGEATPGLRLRVVCDRFPDFQGIEVVPVPWTEASEAAELARGDVGVSWLPDDVWSRGKCGLKVLQYQAAGLPTIANPVGAHAEMIEPGATGFLASTPDEWIDAVRAARADPDLRARMGRAARSRIESHYSIAAWAPTFVAAATGLDRPESPDLKSGRPSTRFAAPAPFVMRKRVGKESEPPAKAGSFEPPHREQD
jgi:glycosyltransferase involved in cell wall biosynthesis